MNREFLINILFLITINALIKPVYLFGIDRNVQNLLENGIYGFYAEMLSLTLIFQILTDFGIQYYNNRQISQHRHLLVKYFPSLLLLKGVFSLVFIIVVAIAGWFTGYWSSHPLVLSLLILNQVLLSLLLFLRSNVSGLGFYRMDSFLSILDKLLMIFCLSWVLWAGIGITHFELTHFVASQSLSYLLAIIVALYILRRHLKGIRFKLKLNFVLVIFRQALPYALAVFLMAIYTRIDMVMLGQMLVDGSLETDAYAAAYRLLDAANMLGFLFAGLLLPMFARLIKEKKEVASLVRISIKMIFAGAIPLALALNIFQLPVMEALYDDANISWGRILGWLILSFIAVSGTYIYGSLLVANGSLRAMNFIFIIGVIANLILNFLLIPTMKGEGAAIATCITQFFVFFSELLLAQKLLGLKTKPRLLFQIVFFTLLCAIGAIGAYHFVDQFSFWIWPFLFCLLLGALLAFLMKMIDIKAMMELIKQKTS